MNSEQGKAVKENSHSFIQSIIPKVVWRDLTEKKKIQAMKVGVSDDIRSGHLLRASFSQLTRNKDRKRDGKFTLTYYLNKL
jgi:hypothetical protein